MPAAPSPPPSPFGEGDHACAADGVDLAADLGWALGVVFRSYVKTVNVVTAEVPGGPRGYQVLAAAVRGLQGSQLALAGQLGIDRTVMTYLIDDIERAGLVERQPDPTDRRARRVVVTAAGHALVARLQERLRDAEDHVLGALRDGDRDTFRSLLRQVATRANALDPLDHPCEPAEQLKAIDDPPPRRRARR